MKKYVTVLIFFLFFTITANSNLVSAELSDQLLKEDKCLSCHKEMELMPEDFQDFDIHLQPGLSCAGCHGGDPTSEDPEEAMSPKAGFVGVPANKDVPEFCGKCHSDIEIMRTFQPRIATDQVQQFYTSVHGKKLSKGDTKVAECVSCHTAHRIASAKDTRSSVHPLNVPVTCKKCHSNADYMKEYNIPTDQYEKYANSVHGIELLEKDDTSAPTCNDCHGNHGATPPGVESVAHVCGNCHVNNLNYFESSPMAEAYSSMEIHACEQCHGNHDVQKTHDDMVGVGENSVCLDCHTEEDKGYESAKKIYASISELVQSYHHAELKLKEVQQKGMDDVDILFLLRDAHQTLIHSRTLVHTFDPDKIKEKTSEGVKKTGESIELANKEIKDYYIRRRGFGIATIFITVLVIALFFKIRAMEKKT